MSTVTKPLVLDETAQLILTELRRLTAVQSAADISEAVKIALLDCFAHVAWTDEHGQDYYNALATALYPQEEPESISVVYTQSGTVYDYQSLNDLKEDLIVTAYYDSERSEVVSNYTLSGTLAPGTQTITVSIGEASDTFDVYVTGDALHGITWHSGSRYAYDTGAITNESNWNYSDKFTVPAPYIYKLEKNNSSDYKAGLYVWDDEDFYMGYIEEAGTGDASGSETGFYGNINLVPGYKYALSVKNDNNTFASSDIEFMSVNNESTAVDSFTISLADLANNVTENAGKAGTLGYSYELNIASILSSHGVNASNWNTKFVKVNYLGHVAYTEMGGAIRMFKKGTTYANDLPFMFSVWMASVLCFHIAGVTGLANVKSYLVEHDVELVFN